MELAMQIFVFFTIFDLDISLGNKDSPLLGALVIVSISPPGIPVRSAIEDAGNLLSGTPHLLTIRDSTLVVIVQPCTSWFIKWHWPILLFFSNTVNKENLQRALHHSLNSSKGCDQVNGRFKEERLPKVGNVDIVILFTKTLTRNETDEQRNEELQLDSLKVTLFHLFLSSHSSQRIRLNTRTAVSTRMLLNKSTIGSINLLAKSVTTAMDQLLLLDQTKQERKYYPRNKLNSLKISGDGLDSQIGKTNVAEQSKRNEKRKRNINNEYNLLMQKPTVVIKSMKVYRKEKTQQLPGTSDSDKLKMDYIPNNSTSEPTKTSDMNSPIKDKNITVGSSTKKVDISSWPAERNGDPRGTKTTVSNFNDGSAYAPEHASNTSSQAIPPRNRTGIQNLLSSSATSITARLLHIIDNSINKSYYYTNRRPTNWDLSAEEEDPPSNERNNGTSELHEKEKSQISTDGSQLSKADHSISNLSDGKESSESSNDSSIWWWLPSRSTHRGRSKVVKYKSFNETWWRKKFSYVPNATAEKNYQKLSSSSVNSTEKNNETSESESGRAIHSTYAYSEKGDEIKNSSNEFEVISKSKVDKAGNSSSWRRTLIESLEAWFSVTVEYIIFVVTFVCVYVLLLLSVASMKRCRRRKGYAKGMPTDNKNQNGLKDESPGDQQLTKEAETSSSSLSPMNSEIERYNTSCHISQSSRNSPTAKRRSTNGRNRSVFKKRADSLYLRDDFVSGMLNSSTSSNSFRLNSAIKRYKSAPALPFPEMMSPHEEINMSDLLWKDLETYYNPNIGRTALADSPWEGMSKSLDTSSFPETEVHTPPWETLQK